MNSKNIFLLLTCVIYGTCFAADPENKDQELKRLFFSLPTDLQGEILHVKSFNNRVAYTFMQVNKEWSQKIIAHRNEQIDVFNKEHPVAWFHIYQMNVCENDIKYKNRDKNSFKVHCDSQEILINPSTVVFDCAGNYAKGFSTDLGKKLKQYTFHYPSHSVIAVSRSKAQYTCDKTIYDAVPDIRRTVCFLLIRPSSLNESSTYTLAYDRDMDTRIVNWKGRLALAGWHVRISCVAIQNGTLVIDPGFDGPKMTIANNYEISKE